ncbi:MAG: Zn-ribbon containing protein [Candidatus Aenigmarchaeota archaeon]|nr:Zn-ribbon containing protein [Candidatus Aenigmarchaeota archaeon]
MAHKCLRCGAVYEDSDPSILSGCKCGSVFFMYFRSLEDIEKFKAMNKELKKKKTTLEKELKRKIKRFEVETIKVPIEGVYEISINALMNGKPLIIHEKNRAYIIHLPSIFEKLKR